MLFVVVYLFIDCASLNEMMLWVMNRSKQDDSLKDPIRYRQRSLVNMCCYVLSKYLGKDLPLLVRQLPPDLYELCDEFYRQQPYFGQD